MEEFLQPFSIPELNVEISKRSTNDISIYTGVMVAIKIAIEHMIEMVIDG